MDVCVCVYIYVCICIYMYKYTSVWVKKHINTCFL